MLEIRNLKATVEKKTILNGLNLHIKPGEVHAIMGPNGSGKSTLSNILSGKKGYEVTGDILFENMTPVTSIILAKKIEDVILNFEPRARLVGVRAEPILDRNTYEVTIEFYVVNQPPELVDLSVMLERLR